MASFVDFVLSRESRFQDCESSEVHTAVLRGHPIQPVFLVSWGGVRLSPLGTSAINWPIVPAPDDR
jgi:hypothetical protein